VNFRNFGIGMAVLLLAAGGLKGQLTLLDGSQLSCQDCHVTGNWKRIELSSFDHDLTRFPLSGMHEKPACAECHEGGSFEAVHRFAEAETECSACHQDIHGGRNGDACWECHSSFGWETVTDGFDHGLTGFPLRGGHAGADCSDCHGDGFYAVNSACGACHFQDYTATEDHLLHRYPEDCSLCHEPENWRSAFDHQALGFGLDGAHREIRCIECHSSGYGPMPGECYSCHQADYETAAVDHSAAGFGRDCRSCHSTSLWAPVHWNHAITSYALEGGHLAASCGDCHSGSEFKGTSTACYSCHEADYLSPANPYHREEAFPLDCSECHGFSTWETQVFDHLRVGFPLENAHRLEICSLCHGDPPVYAVDAECVSCHLDDYNGTVSPDHRQENYSQNCRACHSTIQWKGAFFDHSLTGFPLAGGHDLGIDACESCHKNEPKNTLENAVCYDCHSEDYEGTLNPDHEAGGYSVNCEVCHSIEAWQPASFNHDLTDFPLSGQHASLECTDCHENLNYSIQLPLNCSGCHDPALISAANINWDHISRGTLDNCENCHRPEGWTPSIFMHSEGTDCYSCHEPEWSGAMNPPHSENAFPPSLCAQCHTSTETWNGAVFDHDQTGFPLTGAHISTACEACHVEGRYDNMPTSCGDALCHLSDYQQTADPDHEASQFPLDCVPCHTTAAWKPSTFDHDAAFPIYSGQHRGEWDNCRDCHIGGNYPEFSCTSADGCHEHNLSEMNSEHDDVNGYSPNPPSSECLRCHPTGDEDDEGGDRILKPERPKVDKIHKMRKVE